MFVACDDVYDDDESYAPDVTNATLQSPSVEDIVITASTDGTSQTITWPVVHGAGGYLCSVYDVTNPDEPVAVNDIVEKVVDGCSLTLSRSEDTNYKFSIKTLGNTKYNNKDAESATEMSFSTFTPSFATIPAGIDLTTWFAENPIPEEAITTNLCYDLEAGQEYYISDDIDFFNHLVTLRTTNKANPAKIIFTGTDASIRTSTGIELKYINFDCSASMAPFIELSETPDENIKGATGSGDCYNIINNVVINGCKIEGVNYNLIYDSNKKYCIGNFLINNSVIHLTSNSLTNINGNAVIYFKAGWINGTTIKNSTIWNTGNSDAKYFIQYNNSCRADRGGYATNSVNFMNNTFYNLAKAGQWANYSGYAGRTTSYWVMTNNIFVDCGNKQIPRRFLAGRGNQSTATFGYNTYMFDGTFESVDGSVAPYDNSGTAIEEDPGFADPANGDFTISGSTQLEKRTGDPRWLPEETAAE